MKCYFLSLIVQYPIGTEHVSLFSLLQVSPEYSYADSVGHLLHTSCLNKPVVLLNLQNDRIGLLTFLGTVLTNKTFS